MTTSTTFEAWMARVNAIMNRKFGFIADDMPDFVWYDTYDDGITPVEAIIEAMEYWKDGGF